MGDFGRRLLLWSPRVLGIVVAAFFAAFALDAFREGAAAFLLHLTPALVLLAVVAVAWRWPAVGGVAFVALAALYAVTASARPDWILAIAAPLLGVGALFLWSWRQRPGLPHPK